MPPRDVPIIDDFGIELRNRFIVFTGGTGLRLAGFPAWENADRDLRHFTTADVPFGSIDEPFDDSDEGWRIVIYEDGGYVYVAEADDAHAEVFPRVFRVPRDRYFEEWARVIDEYNPVEPV